MFAQVIDSGTSFLVGPTDQVQKLTNALGAFGPDVFFRFPTIWSETFSQICWMFFLKLFSISWIVECHYEFVNHFVFLFRKTACIGLIARTQTCQPSPSQSADTLRRFRGTRGCLVRYQVFIMAYFSHTQFFVRTYFLKTKHFSWFKFYCMNLTHHFESTGRKVHFSHGRRHQRLLDPRWCLYAPLLYRVWFR